MQKKGIKLIAMLLMAIMVIGTLAGCTNGGSGSGSNNSKGGSDAPRELELCMGQTRWTADDIDDSHMAAYVKSIEEATNTKIKMNAPTHTDFNDKLAALMSSGTYPDVIRPQQAWDTVVQYATRGYLIPLTDYIKNDTRFKDFLADSDLSIYQMGNDIYGIPTNLGNCKIFWFRQDMIDKYGLKVGDTMTTDEFVTEMKKVNQSEIIPLCIPKWIVNFQIYYNFFGAYGGLKKDENGKWIDGIQTQEMKDALTWLKEIYDLGLVDKEFITNQNADMREKFYSGKAVAMVDYSTYYLNIKNNSEGAGAPTTGVPVYTLVGPKGGKGNVNESGNEAFSITNKAKNVDACLDVIHWILFEKQGILNASFGLENVHYTIENGVLTSTEAAKAAGYNFSVTGLGTAFVPIDVTTLPFSFDGVKNEDLTRSNSIVATSLKSDYLGPMIKVPGGASPIYDEIASTYNDTLYELAAAVMMSTKTLDQAYADYEQWFKSVNGEGMLAELNK